MFLIRGLAGELCPEDGDDGTHRIGKVVDRIEDNGNGAGCGTDQCFEAREKYIRHDSDNGSPYDRLFTGCRGFRSLHSVLCRLRFEPGVRSNNFFHFVFHIRDLHLRPRRGDEASCHRVFATDRRTSGEGSRDVSTHPRAYPAPSGSSRGSPWSACSHRCICRP